MSILAAVLGVVLSAFYLARNCHHSCDNAHKKLNMHDTQQMNLRLSCILILLSSLSAYISVLLLVPIYKSIILSGLAMWCPLARKL